MILNILISEYLSYILIVIIPTIIFVIYKYGSRTFTLENDYGFPGPRPFPFLGNMLDLEKDTYEWDIKYQQIFGHIYPIYMGEKGIFVVSDEAILQQILIKDAKSFINRIIFRITSKISKKGLMELKGQDWERVRALVSPSFTSGKLKNMFSLIDKSVKEMIDNLPTTSNVNCKEVFGLITMDVIAKTMFGMDINTSIKTSNPFVKHAQDLMKFSSSNRHFIIAETFHLTSLIENIFPKGFQTTKATEFFEKALKTNINSRRYANEEHHDFLALLLKAHNELENEQNSSENNDKVLYSGLTAEEITAQSILFLLASYESTTALLTFFSYYLAMNPDMQDEIYQELVQNIPDKANITYDILPNLKLLEQGVHECLRICPPVGRISRKCTKDTTLISSTGQTIQAKKGMCFKIPVNAIHHDERLWPEPNKFDIHRFDKENGNRNKLSFMPFGLGPRMCVGKRFAILEVKLVIANLLRKYEILPCDETPTQLNLESHTLTTSKDPVIVNLKTR